MHIVASEYLTPFYSIAPGALAAGGGYVWFSSGRGWLGSRRKTLWQPQWVRTCESTYLPRAR